MQQDLVLTLDRTAIPERVLIDARRLRQILGNLLSNAIKFTVSGSVTVTATIVADTAAGGEAGSGPTSGERLRVAVRDTGIGIAESDRSTVFEKFRQLDGGTTRRFGGTGLGLAISQMLAHAMDGDIELTSIIGSGSTFALDLPLARAAPAALPVHREPPSSLAEARVVLAGASPIAQGVLRAVLTPHVASFAVAADAAAGLERLIAQADDVLIIDVSTVSDAIEAKVAQLAVAAHAVCSAGGKTVILWPNQPSAEHARLMAMGVAAVIGKPVTSIVLLQQLTALFDRVSDGSEPATADASLELATT